MDVELRRVRDWPGRMRRLAIALTVVGCGGGTEPSGSPPPSTDTKPAHISISAGSGQTARIKSPVSVRPAVKVTTAGGAPASGVTVTFAVTAGGGNIAGGSAVTDASGTATVGSWTLGATAGPQAISASISTPGVAPAVVSATARLPYWTVLVYMAADNTLTWSAVQDLAEMDAAGYDPEVRVVVQAEFSPQQFALKGCTPACVGMSTYNTFRYVIRPGPGTDGLDETVEDLGSNRNMTSTAELREFVTWGEAQYPAQRTMLVLWDHGGGYKGMLEDVTSAGPNLMSPAQLKPALSGLSLDVIAFDMCLMGGYETLESISGLAHYAVFSEEAVPGEGYPYDSILDGIQASPTAPSMNLVQLATSAFDASYAGSRSSTTISAYDLGKYDSFRSALGTVAQTLTGNLGTLRPAIAAAAVGSQKYEYSELTDLVNFVDSLKARTTDATLLSQLTTLRTAAIGGFRLDSRARNGSGVAVGAEPDVSRSNGLHVVLPTGVNGDQFFAGGTSSLTHYQELYPGLPWTDFLTAWTNGQATAAYVDQNDTRFESYLAWDPAASGLGIDVDYWIVEPSGNLYIPYVGTVTPNGSFTAESAVAGTAYEGWITRRYLEVGHYAFYANLWSDPPAAIVPVNLFYRNGQTVSLTPLYAVGSEPQLSTGASWLSDATPSFAEVDGGAYSDLRPVGVLDIDPPSPLKASFSRTAASRELQPQVLGHVQAGLRPVAPRAPNPSFSLARIASTRTVTPSITASQFATARRVIGTRSIQRRSQVRTLEARP
jgi:hypothetical protein